MDEPEFILPDCRPDDSPQKQTTPFTVIKIEQVESELNSVSEINKFLQSSNSSRQTIMEPTIMLIEGSANNIWNKASPKVNSNFQSLVHVGSEKVPVILTCAGCNQRFRVMRRRDQLTVPVPFKCSKCEHNNISGNLRSPLGPIPVSLPIPLSKKRAKEMSSFKCNVCTKVFSQSDHFKTHKCGVASSRNFKHMCNTCGKTFSNVTFLNRHNCEVAMKNSFRCHICGTTFAENASLLKHLPLHSGLKSDATNVLDFPNLSRPSSSSSMSSNNTVPGKNRRKCTFCDLTFSTGSSLKLHIKRHYVRKQYVCNVCFKPVRNNRSLARHRREHGKILTQKSNKLKRRKLNKTLSKKLQYPCTYCDYHFSEIHLRSQHVQTEHENQLPFKCHTCNKRFSRKRELTSHSSTHLEKQRHSCDFCGDTFDYLSSLMRHQRTKHKPSNPAQEEETAYNLEVEKSVLLAKDVETVILNIMECLQEAESDDHDPEKENPALLQQLYLSRQKPCKCEICGRRFTYQVSYLSHLRSHHVSARIKKNEVLLRAKSFDCDECGKRFSHSILLKNHRSIHKRANSKKERKPKSPNSKEPSVIKLEVESPVENISKPNKNFANKIQVNQVDTEKPKTIATTSSELTSPKPKATEVTKNQSSFRQRFDNDLKPIESILDRLPAGITVTITPRTESTPSIPGPSQSTSYGVNQRIKVEAETGVRFPEGLSVSNGSSVLIQQRPAPVHILPKAAYYVMPVRAHKRFQLPKSVDGTPINNPFTCLTCGRSCARKADLLKHSLTHNTGKRFKCDVCGLSFSYPKCFSKHMRSHNEDSNEPENSIPVRKGNEKPGHCLVCGQWYACKSDLIKHSLDHAEEKPFKCSVCGQIFSYRKCFETHCKAHAFEDEDNGNTDMDYQDSVNTNQLHASPATYLGTSTTNQLHLFNQSNVHSTAEVNNEDLLEVKLEYASESSSDSPTFSDQQARESNRNPANQQADISFQSSSENIFQVIKT